MSEPLSWQETHIVVPTHAMCWHCEKPTQFVQLDFQTWLHPGECTAAKWREYDEANRQRDAEVGPA